jgi:hypothetical protein
VQERVSLLTSIPSMMLLQQIEWETSHTLAKHRLSEDRYGSSAAGFFIGGEVKR